jgi:hypothetical protein
MILSKNLLANLESTFAQRLGILVLATLTIEDCKIVQRCSNLNPFEKNRISDV